MGQKDNEVLELRAKLRRVEDAYEQINEQAAQSLNRIVSMDDGPRYIDEVGRETSYFKGLHGSLLKLAEALGHDAEVS